MPAGRLTALGATLACHHGLLALLLLLPACRPGPEGRQPAGSLAGTTHAYRCEDGSRVTARFEPERVWLFLPGRTLSLPQVPSASGFQYTDGKMKLAYRDEEARFEKHGAAATRCRNEPAEVPWEEARLRGVDFRATGHEPGWWLEIDDGSGFVFASNLDSARLRFPPATVQAAETTMTYVSEADGRILRAEIENRECTDLREGERVTTAVRVVLDGREYRGCGRKLK